MLSVALGVLATALAQTGILATLYKKSDRSVFIFLYTVFKRFGSIVPDKLEQIAVHLLQVVTFGIRFGVRADNNNLSAEQAWEVYERIRENVEFHIKHSIKTPWVGGNNGH